MRPPLSSVAHPRVLVATLGFALPAPLASPAVSRCCTIALCAATPRRRSLSSKPGAVPPGALPPSLTADETNVYAGEITARVLSEREKKIVAYRQQYKCAGCGCLLPPTHQIDHIVPLALGGTNGLTNLQALCVRCHVRKTRGQRHDMLSSRTAREAAELSSLQLLRGMNQQQLAAVVCADGPLRVAAGPGTGKTRVLTARIAHLVEEARVPPQRVLA
ncbi:hypothetical protein EMIHUDRAFT_250677, partial [Emiliania huxleyi CCMP1516]|uniref:HNH nuclease domain-containing protein n=2 Tax=Emiliania huxleyi TaxID=2903 RepID=A0A0D3HYS7_EMIH1